MVKQLEIGVRGMHCAHCERAVAAELLRVDGITAAQASASLGLVTITCEPEVQESRVRNAVYEAGCELISWANDGQD